MDEAYITSCVVFIRAGAAPLGTGFFVLPDGYILTCYHVLNNDNVDLSQPDHPNVTAKWSDPNGRQFESDCRYVPEYSNKQCDIAVLKVKSPFRSLPFVSLGDLHGDGDIYSYGYLYHRNFEGYPIRGKIVGIAKMLEPRLPPFLIVIGGTNVDEGASGAPLCLKATNKVVGIIKEKLEQRAGAHAIPIDVVYKNWPDLKDQNAIFSKQIHDRNEKDDLVEFIADLYTKLAWEVNFTVSISDSHHFEADIVVTIQIEASDLLVTYGIMCIATDKEEIQYDMVQNEILNLRNGIYAGRITFGKIISNKPLSTDCQQRTTPDRSKIEFMTRQEFINSLIHFDRYLAQIKTQYESNDLWTYYEDLDCHKVGTRARISVATLIQEWLADKLSSPHIAIIGEYGTGKTSLCQKLAYDLARRYGTDYDRIPILIDLMEFRSGLSMQSAITRTLRNTCHVKADYSVFKEMDAAGLLVLIIDGFDEMELVSTRHAINANLRELFNAMTPKSKVLMTCRKEYLEAHGGMSEILRDERPLYNTHPWFECFELMFFDEVQIRKVIEKRKPERHEDYFNRIVNTIELRDLAFRPLFLDKIIDTMKDIVEGNIQYINTARIYELYIDRYFEKLHTIGGQLKINESLANDIMTKIAEIMHRNRTNIIEMTEIERMLDTTYQSELAHLTSRFSLDEIRDNILTFTVLRGSVVDGFKFNHISFQYYFRAKCLFGGIRDGRKELFNVKFVGAETILFMRDMLNISHKEILLKWLKDRNINIQKYAVILLGFVWEVRAGKSGQEMLPEESKDVIDAIKRIKNGYEESSNKEESHVRKHATLTLTIMGEEMYNEDIVNILLYDNDYTHRWYAAIGIYQLVMRNRENCRYFLQAVMEIYNRDEEIEGIRIVCRRILEACGCFRRVGD